MSYTAATQLDGAFGKVLLGVAFSQDDIGRRIKAAREAQGLTQLSFALKAGVSPSTISKWERGQLPPVRELIRVADLLEIDPAELVEPATAPDQTEILARLAEHEKLLREIAKQLDLLDKGQGSLQDALGVPRGGHGSGRGRATGRPGDPRPLSSPSG